MSFTITIDFDLSPEDLELLKAIGSRVSDSINNAGKRRLDNTTVMPITESQAVKELLRDALKTDNQIRHESKDCPTCWHYRRSLCQEPTTNPTPEEAKPTVLMDLSGWMPQPGDPDLSKDPEWQALKEEWKKSLKPTNPALFDTGTGELDNKENE